MLDKECINCHIIKSLDEFYSYWSHKAKKYYKQNSCKKCKNIYSELYRKNHKEEFKKYNKNYCKRNPQKRKESVRKARKQNEYNKKRKKRDKLFHLKTNLRCRLNSALKVKKWHKNTHFAQYVGCTLIELKVHLEMQFHTGMTWNNYGKWHIDHIIPLASAKTVPELENLFHFSNLQPLWAYDNMKKGANYGG